ncbi:tetratricopeptide repeat protein, partial [Nostoc sp. CALU 1950]|uniref:tetratricopeptide repeat protein n=1 Tax=Nostoc sp. CALU 1950 TaxID=3104321 RepID=UPI003EBFE083
MVLKLTNWDNNFAVKGDEEYQALVRTLNFIEGFGLLFVRCSPAEGERIITKVKEDIKDKSIEVLRLDKSVNNLYEIIEKLNNKESINFLFVTGLHSSFYEYEECKILNGWNSKDIYSYSWKGVPPVLINLNQQRESFRDNFNICFVFLLPQFAIKYFIQRAPDFFDWRSGMFEFPIDPETLKQETSRIFPAGDYEKYTTLTAEERNREIITIQELIVEDHQTVSLKSKLMLELGNLHFIEQDYKGAIYAYNEAIKIKNTFCEAWHNRGSALLILGQYEEALASFDHALKIQPDFDESWDNRGTILLILGRYEEAIASYDQALKIQPDDYELWNNRGNALFNLGRYEKAIASYDQALKIQPDKYEAWNNRGIALFNLEQYKKAIASYDQALKIQPDDYELWNNRGNALFNLGRYEKAIASYDQALRIQPDKYEAWNNRGNALFNLEQYEETVASFDQVLRIQPDNYKVWNNRGNALFNLEQYKEAVASYDQALRIQPDNHEAWNNRGNALFNLEQYKEAVASFDQALKIQPDNH